MFVLTGGGQNFMTPDPDVRAQSPGLAMPLSEIASQATSGPKRHYSYHRCLYVFACSYDSNL